MEDEVQNREPPLSPDEIFTDKEERRLRELEQLEEVAQFYPQTIRLTREDEEELHKLRAKEMICKKIKGFLRRL